MRRRSTRAQFLAALTLVVGCVDSGGGGGGGGGTLPATGGSDGTVDTGGTRATGGDLSGGGGGGGGSGGDGGDGGASQSITLDGRRYPYYSSCDHRGSSGSLGGRCRDWYSGPNPPSLSSSCNDSYMREPCSSDDRVGQCQLDPVVGVIAVYNYYAPTWTAESARDACIGGYRNDNKRWIPAPGAGDAGLDDAGVRDASAEGGR